MPRPNIMRISNTSANGKTSFIAQMAKATSCLTKRSVQTAATSRAAGVVLTAGEQQCVPCEPQDTTNTAPTSNTPAALESHDVITSIASHISDKSTLAALSQTDKTAHNATAPSLAARRAEYIEGRAALSNGRFRDCYYSYYDHFIKLSGKTLSGEDVAELVELLKHNSLLARLDLSRCNIDAASGMAIADALKGNTALISLDMSENNLNVEGAKAFAAAIEVNRTLTHLDLSTNALCGKEKWMVYGPVQHRKDMSGVEALCKAATKASWPDGALRSLRLGDNFLGDYGERLLKGAMDKPAVVEARKREAREQEERFAAQRSRCAEGRCDSSCIWCDHGQC